MTSQCLIIQRLIDQKGRIGNDIILTNDFMLHKPTRKKLVITSSIGMSSLNFGLLDFMHPIAQHNSLCIAISIPETIGAHMQCPGVQGYYSSDSATECKKKVFIYLVSHLQNMSVIIIIFLCHHQSNVLRLSLSETSFKSPYSSRSSSGIINKSLSCLQQVSGIRWRESRISFSILI